MTNKNQKGQKCVYNQGFTILEVLISLTLLAVFTTVYYTTQSNNLLDSMQLDEKIQLKALCVNELNKLIINPPVLTSQLLLKPETKRIEDYPNFEYTVEYKEFVIPDIEKIKGEDPDNPQEQSSAFEKTIYSQIQKNLKEILWQIQVTVTNKENGRFHQLSTWIINDSAKVKFDKI